MKNELGLFGFIFLWSLLFSCEQNTVQDASEQINQKVERTTERKRDYASENQVVRNVRVTQETASAFANRVTKINSATRLAEEKYTIAQEILEDMKSYEIDSEQLHLLNARVQVLVEKVYFITVREKQLGVSSNYASLTGQDASQFLREFSEHVNVDHVYSSALDQKMSDYGLMECEDLHTTFRKWFGE